MSKRMLDRHQNADGTYNGVSFMSEISGLSQAEVLWTFNRAKELLAAGHTKVEVKATLKREAREKFGKARP